MINQKPDIIKIREDINITGYSICHNLISNETIYQLKDYWIKNFQKKPKKNMLGVIFT